jgi:hypothetical protein
VADEIDRANDQAEELLKRAILHASQVKYDVEPNGKCHNCLARVPKGRRFCDKDCSDDYTKRKERTK